MCSAPISNSTKASSFFKKYVLLTVNNTLLCTYFTLCNKYKFHCSPSIKLNTVTLKKGGIAYKINFLFDANLHFVYVKHARK